MIRNNSFIQQMDKTYELLHHNKHENKNKDIDILLKDISNTYKNYEDIFSKKQDSFFKRNQLVNPNIFSIEIEQKSNSKYKKNKIFKDIYSDSDPELKKIKNVNIELEIKDINDLLKVIELYPLDNSIEYNVDLSILHKIKEPLQDLNNMIGMKNLKINILDQILFYLQNLQSCSGDFLHTVIYGSPGTGKTEVAKIIGKIFSNLGLLAKDSFKKVTRSDLVAGYLGQTAIKTRDVIKECLGGVLFIDEAYALGNPEKRDSFSKECIDTLCEALSDHKNEIMVIIAGYEKELEECFFNYNKGLDSRFPWRFKVDDYNYQDLYDIFIKKISDIGWKIDTNSLTSEWFKKNKEYFPFFGRDIENLLAKTKIAHSRRIFGKLDIIKKNITLEDVEKGYEMYLQNENIIKLKNDNEIKKSISSMYI
jgi:SpoVK/Ycf46/Vps4 family AAA+-type ATPase